MEGNTADNALIGSLNDVKKVIGVMSGKGGVGKSTVSTLLAIELAQQGKKVGILDADITGPSIPRAFGIKGSCTANQFGMVPPVTRNGIKIMSINLLLPNEDDPVIWRGPLIGGAVKQFWEETFWGELDYLVVDLPPGTGDVALTVMQSIPLNGLVVVTSPQDLSLMVVKKSIKMAEKLDAPVIGLVENMSSFVCPHCGEQFQMFGNNKVKQAADSTGLNVLARLPWDKNINISMDNGTIEESIPEEIISALAGLTEIVMGL